jgi:hypothetical protein
VFVSSSPPPSSSSCPFDLCWKKFVLIGPWRDQSFCPQTTTNNQQNYQKMLFVDYYFII